jgi:hypothetical protein
MDLGTGDGRVGAYGQRGRRRWLSVGPAAILAAP